jgi:predicted lipoprotein with Yx(FWY)xxD motif
VETARLEASDMRVRRVALLLSVSVVLAGCGDGSVDEAADPEEAEPEEAGPGDDPGTVEDETADDDTAEEPTDDATDAVEATVTTADTDFGEALVDADGMSLYLFEQDAAGDSTCYDDCEANWPPLLEEDPVAGEGADEALLGTAGRDDGSAQVTYDGWPLYYWAGDDAPGDTAGQGVGDVWWLVAPDGSAITAAESSSTGY